MLIKRIAVENVRSFLERQELLLDGHISIIIGPNGGGKTNLLDSIVAMLRRHLFASGNLVEQDYGNSTMRWGVQANSQLTNLILEKHSFALDSPQLIEIELEASTSDIAVMTAIKRDADSLVEKSKKDFANNPWDVCKDWDVAQIKSGDRFVYKWNGSGLEADMDARARHFREYLQLFEIDNRMRNEVGQTSLQMPMVYLPVNRASNGFQSGIRLADYNDVEQKRVFDATSSKSGSNLIQMAIGRIARKFRHLQENSNQDARRAFKCDPQMKELTNDLLSLGYEWELETVNIDANQYDVRLKKQGNSFLVAAASSGERELLTYLFAIHALNVRDALILIDEPELHLHPKWQKALFELFKKLAKNTGNQFVMATHSPSFITPASIQYVSRVYSENQRSRVIRLNSTDLPNAKHLFSAVNTQNNERIFFADHVALVEGPSDRMFFERVLEIRSASRSMRRDKTLEVISIAGKGLFPSYKKLLQACAVGCSIVADRDYLQQIGDDTIKPLFKVDNDEIKKKVIGESSSIDGASLVAAIDRAISTESWDDAHDIWAYIKSRRIKLIENLSDKDRRTIESFITKRASEGIFVLKRGALEDYLPTGYKAKDIEKLIELVGSDDFWDRLPAEGKAEISDIADALLDATQNSGVSVAPTQMVD